ncbi:uncharacterized protein LOC134298611 [Anolis carolinensis]|uniref:uncharacterized protein LOC134298611 n=1 Tax=Anolis carolinensis TaxID=28377 RepID=UPI002F2B7A37
MAMTQLCLQTLSLVPQLSSPLPAFFHVRARETQTWPPRRLLAFYRQPCRDRPFREKGRARGAAETGIGRRGADRLCPPDPPLGSQPPPGSSQTQLWVAVASRRRARSPGKQGAAESPWKRRSQALPHPAPAARLPAKEVFALPHAPTSTRFLSGGQLQTKAQSLLAGEQGPSAVTEGKSLVQYDPGIHRGYVPELTTEIGNHG